VKLTYDPRYNIAYIRFQEKTAEVEAIRISDEMIVDVAPDGTIYGVELLNANQQLRREDGGVLVVINEATGEQAEIPLAVRSPKARSVRKRRGAKPTARKRG